MTYSVEDFLDGLEKLWDSDKAEAAFEGNALQGLRQKTAEARGDLEQNHVRIAGFQNRADMDKGCAFDIVSRPRHYAAGGIEAKDALASMFAMSDPEHLTPIMYYWWGCAFKYLWRWTNKGGTLDLVKAKQCIDFLMEEYGDYGEL